MTSCSRRISEREEKPVEKEKQVEKEKPVEEEKNLLNNLPSFSLVFG